MAAGLAVSLYSYFGVSYGWFPVTKAQAPMYGSLAMLASVLVVFIVSLATHKSERAVIERRFVTNQ